MSQSSCIFSLYFLFKFIVVSNWMYQFLYLVFKSWCPPFLWTILLVRLSVELFIWLSEIFISNIISVWVFFCMFVSISYLIFRTHIDFLVLSFCLYVLMEFIQGSTFVFFHFFEHIYPYSFGNSLSGISTKSLSLGEFFRFWRGYVVLGFHVFYIEICVSEVRLLIEFLKKIALNLSHLFLSSWKCLPYSEEARS